MAQTRKQLMARGNVYLNPEDFKKLQKQKYNKKSLFKSGNDYFLAPNEAKKLEFSNPVNQVSGGQEPQDLLSIFEQAFPGQGQAFYDKMFSEQVGPGGALQPATNEQLKKDFETQFNPYFQEIQDKYKKEFDTQNTRNTQDFGASTGNLDISGARGTADYQTWLSNQAQQEQINAQNAIGGYNRNYGEAFGSPMQLQQEGLRSRQYQQGLDQAALGQQRSVEDLQRQRDLLQQNYSRREYDLAQLNKQRNTELEDQKQTAQGEYANTYRYSNVL